MYSIEDNKLILNGELAFINDKLYVSTNKKSISEDLSNADLIDTNKINKIVIKDTCKSYIITYDNHIEEINSNNISEYSYNDLLKSNIKRITTLCLYPNKNVINYINKECKSYCEIGVRYGATTSYVLEYINKYKLDIRLHLFEINKIYYDFLVKKYKNINNCNIHFGDARETLKLYNDEKFDIVYFDACHLYNVDKQILDNLIKHLNDKCTIIFDDYQMNDVKRLVDEFELKYKYKFNIVKT